jgi:hypothetical protein
MRLLPYWFYLAGSAGFAAGTLVVIMKRLSAYLLPYWFYLAGSVGFATGTLIVIARGR